MKNKVLFFCFCILCNTLYSLDFKNFTEGVFISKNYVDYEFRIKNIQPYKYVDYCSLTIMTNSPVFGYGMLHKDGTMPCFIKESTIIDNFIQFKCIRLDPEYSDSLESITDYLNNVASESFYVQYKVIDNDEIVEYRDDINGYEPICFYRISGPAKIPVKKATINDSNVRLRVKPNLNCDTWAKLQKGVEVQVKDRSEEKFEIDGESWYWYKVDNPNYPDGWVYGKYLDIE